VTEVRHPLAPLVDVFVYAPIGAAVVVKDRLPEIVGTGRQQVETRVRVARLVGELAVTVGRRKLVKQLERFAESRRAAGALIDVDESEAEASEPDAVVDAPAAFAPEESVDPVSESDLPIPGYDSLAASQVVDRLAALSREELTVVRTYESARRHRRTVLHRIDQLVA
jgi:hypothetical protein